jgi:predicted enzyme related to lactoylglutathione lyase
MPWLVPRDEVAAAAPSRPGNDHPSRLIGDHLAQANDRRRTPMDRAGPRFLGVELFFDDLGRAKGFYEGVLGLALSDEDPDRYARFGAGDSFVCLERKGSESYPSRDKAVLFFEVPDLREAIEAAGRERIVGGQLEQGQGDRPWAVLSRGPQRAAARGGTELTPRVRRECAADERPGRLSAFASP